MNYLVILIMQIIQVGKRRAIYIPKQVADELGIEEGDKLILEVKNGKIILTHVKPVEKNIFWSEVSVGEVEEVGEEITRDITGSR